MTQTKINTREIIVEILLAVSGGEGYSHVILRGVLEKYDYLDGKDKAFIKRVTEGCLERRLTLDYYLDAFSRTPVEKMKPFIRELLRMSTYQILFLSKVPDSAAINEAVKLARKKGFQGLTGFVNGVLRNISRQGREYPLPDREKEPVKYLSVKYSMPEWLVEKLQADYGQEQTEQILQGLLSIYPVTIRFQDPVPEIKREKILQQMKEQGIQIRKHPYHRSAYQLTNLEGIAALPGFSEGLFTVQDVSSMLAVEAAGIRSGDQVADVCAAPGGKTAYAAMKAGADGQVTAGDLTEAKTELIRDTCFRLGLTNVTIQVWDARECPKEQEGFYDVVLADVPCLGLGVMGHKRDIRYRVKKEDLQTLLPLQREILQAAAKRVRPGGILLYSTCSMTREENENMAEWLETALGLQPETMEKVLPEEFLKSLERPEDLESIRRGRLQLLPGIHETDGFFFARLRKAAE